MASIAICIGLLIIVFYVLLRPGRYTAAQRDMLYGVNHAHRGLHTKDKTVPENSLAAFRAAADFGYGIELDIQLTADGEVVVFHDDTLDRVTEGKGRVDAYTLLQLRELHLEGTGEGIPLFTEMLAAVGGRVPLIVELKTGPHNHTLCEKTLVILRAYNGPYCIESFDPRIVAWFRKNAPDILRGQLSDAPKNFDSEPPLLAFALGHLFTNIIARPQFIAYGIGKKPWTVRLCEAMGALRVCWTARENNDAAALGEENDAIIFEYYAPAVRFK